MPILFYFFYLLLHRYFKRFSNMVSKQEFNRRFSLDVDGKFRGLDYLSELGIVDLFWHKFSKQVDNIKPYMLQKRLLYVPMRVSGHTIKLYFR